MSRRARGRWRRWLVAAGLGFVALHVLGLTFLVHRQAALVYHPVRTVAATPADVGLVYEDVWFRAEDGPRLHGFYVRARRATPRGVVLYCHGNAGNVGHRVKMARLLADLGVDVLLFDYRGFGRSEGTPTEAGTYADAEAAWTHLVETRGVAPAKIVAYGRSLGGPIAASVAARHRLAGLVLDATFESIPALVRDTWPRFLVVERFIAFSYDTAAFLDRVTAPVLVLHSPDDGTIPFAHGERLARRLPDAVFAVTAGGHGDGPLRHPEAYEPPLSAFFDRVLGP